MSVIDEKSRTVVDTIPVGSLPYGVAVDPGRGRVYVANANPSGVGSVSVIDENTNDVIATIATGGAYTQGVAVDPRRAALWVIDGNNTVWKIDQRTLQIVTTVQVDKPSGLAVSPQTGNVYVTSVQRNAVTVINANTAVVRRTIPVAGALNAAVDPARGLVYVPHIRGRQVSVINTTTNNVVRTFRNGWPPWAVDVNPNTGTVYLTSPENSSLTIIRR